MYGWVTTGHIMTTDNAFGVDRGCGDVPGHGGWRQKYMEALKGEDSEVKLEELVCVRRPAWRVMTGEGGETRGERVLTTSMRLSWMRFRVVLSRLLMRPRLDDSYCKTQTHKQAVRSAQTHVGRVKSCTRTHTQACAAASARASEPRQSFKMTIIWRGRRDREGQI